MERQIWQMNQCILQYTTCYEKKKIQAGFGVEDYDTDHNGEGRCSRGCFCKDPDYGADKDPHGKGAVQVGERDEDDNY